MTLPIMMSFPVQAADDAWFDDIEAHALLRQTRIDVADPESSSLVALGMSSFTTAQALASSDLSISAAQILDDYGNPRVAIGVDFTPWALWEVQRLTLGDYQRNQITRFVSRIQLSLAVSKGESSDDRSTRFAPTLRVVLHEQRDPRVHRGPGSLKDCFERTAAPPLEARQALREIAAQRALLDGAQDGPDMELVRARKVALDAEYRTQEALYLAALEDTIRRGMAVCRHDSLVARYTWNSTGYALAFSPSFHSRFDTLKDMRLSGFTSWATIAYGFDPHSTLPSYLPSFIGSHMQVIGQVMFRDNEQRPVSRIPGAPRAVDELTVSTRFRVGGPRLNASIEGAALHDWIAGPGDDSYAKLATGVDFRLTTATWVSLSVGRSFWRDSLPDETSVRLRLKWSLLE